MPKKNHASFLWSELAVHGIITWAEMILRERVAHIEQY